MTTTKDNVIEETARDAASIVNIKDYIIDHNRTQSEDFIDAGARDRRDLYRNRHCVEIAALKCMDGRLNLSRWTGTPVGIIQPFRDKGGVFDLAWSYFGELINSWVDFSIAHDRNCLVFATYHFSKGDPKRGCAAFHSDTEAARSAAANLATQFREVMGKTSPVYPVLVGMETDDEGLIFHSSKDNSFTVADNLSMSTDEVISALRVLYPDLEHFVIKHMAELVRGNQCHIRDVQKAMEDGRRQLIDLDHREQVIAVGINFDWLHIPNKVLIIGPFSDDWRDELITAGTIIKKNIAHKQIDHDAGILLLVNTFCRDKVGSRRWNVAVRSARYLTKLSKEVLDKHHADLTGMPNFSVVTGVVDASTQRMEEIT